MTWTPIDAVLSRWVGPDKPDQPADALVLSTLIEDSERLIRWEYPDVDARIFDPEESDGEEHDHPLEIETLQQVVSQMVIRHLRNPDGTRQFTETEGPFSRNRTFAGDRPGQLWLTDDERRLLGYQPGAPTQKAFTVPQAVPEPGWLGGRHVW